MKVALCVPNLLSYHTFLSDLVISLADRGDQVAVLTDMNVLFAKGAYKTSPDCIFHDIRFPRGASVMKHYRAARCLSRAVDTFRPDILHVHFSATAFTTAMVRSQISCPVIATIQGLITPLTPGPRRSWMRIAETFAYRRMDAVWVLTRDDHAFLKKLVPSYKARIQSSPGFGCRLDVFDGALFSSEEINERRRKLKIGDEETVFCFIGRRTHFKGFHLVVRAFFRLLARGVKGKLLLIGDFDSLHSTGLNPGEIEGIENCPDIIDLGWLADVAPALALADVNVFPSVREGMPVNLMESLAMGVPVITLNTRGCRDVVRDKEDGIVIEKAEVDDLTEAMRILANDVELRMRYSSNSVRGRSRFDRKLWIDEQIRIYESVLAGRLGSQGLDRSSLPLETPVL